MPRSSLPKRPPSSPAAPPAWFRLKRMFGLAAPANAQASNGWHGQGVPAGGRAAMPSVTDYELRHVIARNDRATIYQATERASGRLIALKTVRIGNTSGTDRGLWRERFLREAEAAARLKHDYIVAVHAGGVQGEGDATTGWLAMEWVHGTDMSRYACANRLLPEGVVVGICQRVALALDLAHRAGIVHRDIKPSNVLLDRGGGVHLADFGIAYLSADTSITRTGSFLGTPGYSAPEQSEGLAATEKTDVFTAGIVFYRCLTGRLPFVGDTPHQVLRAILEKDPPKVSSVNPRVLPGLPDLCAVMLAKRPEERPTAKECIRRLETLADKNGFAFDAARLAGFMEQGPIYRAKEEAEIADAFRARAGQARKKREPRAALQAYTIAEAFAADPDPIRAELEKYQRSLRAAAVKRKAIVGLAVACASAAGVSLWLRRPPMRNDLATAAPTAARELVRVSSPQPEGPEPGRSMALVPKVPDRTADLPSSPPAHSASLTSAHPSVPRSSVARASETSKMNEPILEPTLKKTGNRRPSHPEETPISMLSPAPETVVRRTEPAPPKGLAPSPSAGDGYAILKSTPPFARIFVDGKEAGTTPLKTPLRLTAGNHELILEREGCRPLHASFAIGSGDTVGLRYTLETATRKLP